eukprot:4060728-Pyramimonas_sp.AAC.1
MTNPPPLMTNPPPLMTNPPSQLRHRGIHLCARGHPRLQHRGDGHPGGHGVQGQRVHTLSSHLIGPLSGYIDDCGKIVAGGKEKMGWFDTSTLKLASVTTYVHPNERFGMIAATESGTY